MFNKMVTPIGDGGGAHGVWKFVDDFTNLEVVSVCNPNNEGLPIWLNTSKKQKKIMHFGNGITKMKKVNKFKLW